jgi:nitrate reductase NapD
VLVHAAPARSDEVRRALEDIDGVEVHAEDDGGRLVVTVEDVAAGDAGETVLALHRLPGVLSAALVYHHFDPMTGSGGNSDETH